jgi:site-specific DNA-methyltransferase (adenine-specific)
MLCDPAKAAEFDGIAHSFAPGFAPLQYRWGALKLRKEAKRARVRIPEVRSPELSQSVLLTNLDLSRVSHSPGLYVIRSQAGRFLYAGATLSLSERFRRQFQERSVLESWRQLKARRILFTSVNSSVENLAEVFGRLLTHQSRLVAVYSPLLNPDIMAA